MPILALPKLMLSKATSEKIAKKREKKRNEIYIQAYLHPTYLHLLPIIPGRYTDLEVSKAPKT